MSDLYKSFKPMLAASATNEDIEKFQFPLLASPKLDGIRAIVLNGVVMSRSLKPIRNKKVQELFGRIEFEGFDGELILGEATHPDCFNRSTALMGEKIRGGLEDLEITFHVFDMIPEILDASSFVRYQKIKEHFEVLAPLNLNVKVVPQIQVNSLEELLSFEENMLNSGYEGVMVKSLDGKYKHGRSTLKQRLLTKVKRFQDSEAIIIGFEQKRQNIAERELDAFGYQKTTCKKDDFVLVDTLGALIVQDIENGLVFNIGTGFDDAMRKYIWDNQDSLKDNIVKYKHFSTGAKELPRFPTFLGFRDADDMSK